MVGDVCNRAPVRRAGLATFLVIGVYKARAERENRKIGEGGCGVQFSSVCVCVTVFKVLTLFGVFFFIPLVLKRKVFCCLMDSCVLFSRLIRFIIFTFLGGRRGAFCHPKNFFLRKLFFFFVFCILSFIRFCSHLV